MQLNEEKKKTSHISCLTLAHSSNILWPLRQRCDIFTAGDVEKKARASFPDLPVFRRKYVQRVIGPVQEPTLFFDEIEHLADVCLGLAGICVAVATRFGRLVVRSLGRAHLRVAWLTAVVLTAGQNVVYRVL